MKVITLSIRKLTFVFFQWNRIGFVIWCLWRRVFTPHFLREIRIHLDRQLEEQATFSWPSYSQLIWSLNSQTSLMPTLSRDLSVDLCSHRSRAHPLWSSSPSFSFCCLTSCWKQWLARKKKEIAFLVATESPKSRSWQKFYGFQLSKPSSLINLLSINFCLKKDVDKQTSAYVGAKLSQLRSLNRNSRVFDSKSVWNSSC